MSELNDKKKQKNSQKQFNLKLDHMIGITAKSKNGICLSCNGELAYACGSAIVIYNISLNK